MRSVTTRIVLKNLCEDRASMIHVPELTRRASVSHRSNHLPGIDFNYCKLSSITESEGNKSSTTLCEAETI